MTGLIQGKGKKACFTAFLNAFPLLCWVHDLILGKDMNHPQKWLRFCPNGANIIQAKDLSWYLFKQLKADQGVDKLFRVPGKNTYSVLMYRLASDIKILSSN